METRSKNSRVQVEWVFFGSNVEHSRVSKTSFRSIFTCINQLRFLICRVLLFKLKCYNVHELPQAVLVRYTTKPRVIMQ
jgi:hypothetical protein